MGNFHDEEKREKVKKYCSLQFFFKIFFGIFRNFL